MSSPPDSPLPFPSWKLDLLYDGDCPLCLRVAPPVRDVLWPTREELDGVF